MGVLDFIRGRAVAAGGGGTSDLLNPKSWVYDGLGIRKTASGQTVTPATSMTLSVFYACVRGIAEDLAGLPWQVVKAEGNRREIVTEHALSRLLADGMNEELDGYLGKELLVLWALGWGNGPCEIERASISDPTPVALWPIHPALCRPLRDPETKEPGIYVSGFNGNPGVWIPSRDLFHLRGPGDADWGWSVARLAAQDLGNALAASEFEGHIWGSGAVSRIALKYPKKMDDSAHMNRLRRQWVETYSTGQAVAHPLILENGMEVQTLSFNPRDAQMLESIKNGEVRLARWLRVPPTKVGILDRATWNNVEQMDLQYAKETLAPWASRIEAQGRRRCLSIEERRAGLRLKVYLQALQRGDFKTRTEGYARQIGSGQLTPNEARALEDRNPDPRPEADLLWMPSNLSPMRELAKPKPPGAPGLPPGAPSPMTPPENKPPPTVTPAPDDESARAAVISALEGLVGYEVRRVQDRFRLADSRAAKRHADDDEGYRQWGVTFAGEELPKATAMLLPVVQAFARVAAQLGVARPTATRPHEVLARDLAGIVIQQEAEDALSRFKGRPAPDAAHAADALTVRLLAELQRDLVRPRAAKE